MVHDKIEHDIKQYCIKDRKVGYNPNIKRLKHCQEDLFTITFTCIDVHL